MNREEPLKSLSIDQSEELVLSSYRDLGLDKLEDFPLHSVRIEFEKIGSSGKPVSDTVLSEDGALILNIRDTDLASGVKQHLATLVRNLEMPLEFSYIKMFILPFLFPLGMLIPFLSILSALSALDSPTILLAVPVLYSAFVLPVLLYLETQQRNESEQYAARVKVKLDTLPLFAAEETTERSAQLTRRSVPYTIYNFVMYLVGIVVLLVLALSL